jgi:hypothetical protein
MRHVSETTSNRSNGTSYEVGYRRPPRHTRFKPGQSGNPSGRVKGSKNLKSLFHQILNEQVPLIDGSQSKKVTKGEALMRRLVIAALKGDGRSLTTLMRIAEQAGEFQDDDQKDRKLIFEWSTTYEEPPPDRRRPTVPAIDHVRER